MVRGQIDDATLEYAAQQIESLSLLDMVGCMARTKRAREDAALRTRVRTELKAELAAHLRAMMNRPELAAAAVLSRLQTGVDQRGMDLVDAWPLAWNGYCDIYAVNKCNSNSVPPETRYRIELTEKGQAAVVQLPEPSDG